MTHPLRLRTFRLLFVGRTLSALGDAVVPAALAIAISRATGSASALAIVLACAMLPRLLLLPVGGVIGDRFDARKVALATDLVRCAAQLFVGRELIGG
jgi:MFS family permease